MSNTSAKFNGDREAAQAATAETRSDLRPELNVPAEKIPRHIAIIMDGNGRWAQRQQLPRIEGHRRATRAVREVAQECQRLGVQQLTLFCFSSENWRRPGEEAEFLMHLLQQYLIESRSTLMENDVVLKVIGRLDALPAEVQTELRKTLQLTEHNRGACICLAVNYGGRAEIVDAVRSLVREARHGRLQEGDIDEATLADHLYTAGMPEPDLVIRTAGEMRISNFLLWQVSYAEFWFTHRCWPEFGVADLHDAIRDYASRQRRFGSLSP